ncbi:helix-turn-helix domain-containing protein (plasmid) [Nonomuraea sp. CA-143628]|uniref:helix-turn-helix domain-containing protein n=1 Tax=Nonomuraea sp. CA-143628 TaxID=3239997 RepID=UPI003D93C690
MAPTIRIREGVNELLMERFGCSTSGEVAKNIGVSGSAWSRAVRGKSIPGPKLAGLLLQIDGLGFDDLFEVRTEETDRKSA